MALAFFQHCMQVEGFDSQGIAELLNSITEFYCLLSAMKYSFYNLKLYGDISYYQFGVCCFLTIWENVGIPNALTFVKVCGHNSIYVTEVVSKKWQREGSITSSVAEFYLLVLIKGKL